MTKKNLGGRPQIQIDKSQFEGLCYLQCTLVEIAGFFKCSEDTIERWCKRTYNAGFADTYKIYSQEGKISLRRYQYKMAAKNPSMAIWLGKQWLGQKEQIDTNVSGNGMLEGILEYMKNGNKQ